MTNNELLFTSVGDLTRQMSMKKISPVEITTFYLERVGRLNPVLNAFLTISADEALESARLSEQAVMKGEELKLLHGIPIAIKDTENTEGIKTTHGSLLYENHVPNADSIVVSRLRRAGAIILGKSNTPEFAGSGCTQNKLIDPCRNPWNVRKTAGGSSGGSAAAVASGMCVLATGSDSGGSIRVPASFCGVYGIKPDLANIDDFRVTRNNTLDPLLEPGPLTLSVSDAAIFLQVLRDDGNNHSLPLDQGGFDYLSDLNTDISGLKISWNPSFGCTSIDPEVSVITSRAVKAFEEMGAVVEQSNGEIDNLFNEESFAKLNVLHLANQYQAYGALLDEHPNQLTDYFRYALEQGKEVLVEDYVSSLIHMDLLRLKIREFMQNYDLILNPTMPGTAFPLGTPPTMAKDSGSTPEWSYNPFNFIFNMTRHPAATIPCGVSSVGLPVGLHLVGHRGDESMVLKASAAFERIRPWNTYHPSIA